MGMLDMFEAVTVAIFVYREDFGAVKRTVQSALASIPSGSKIDLLVNGDEHLARNIARDELCLGAQGGTVRVWSIQAADKGNAWNQHIHVIAREGLPVIYMDGYVVLNAADIREIINTLRSNEQVLGTSAVPTVGRSAPHLRRIMEKEGGFHGNLCALSWKAIAQIRARNIRIPTGMYRVDSLMGALLSFGLSNDSRIWRPKHCVPVSFNATWGCDEKKLYKWSDIKSWWSRRNRQVRGDIENAAVKYHFTVLVIPFEAIPIDVKSLVDAWMLSCPVAADFVSKSQRHRNAFRSISSYVRPREEALVAIAL